MNFNMPLLSGLFVFVFGVGVLAQINLEPNEGLEIDTLNESDLTRLLLSHTSVGKIDKDNLIINDLIEMIEGSFEGKDVAVQVEMNESLRKRKIFLKVEKISALTLLLIIKENLARGDFKIEGDKVIFPEIEE